MNWDTIKGNWSQAKGKIKENWAELTDDDLLAAEGQMDQLVGLIQKRYGKTKEAAQAEVDAWVRAYR